MEKKKKSDFGGDMSVQPVHTADYSTLLHPKKCKKIEEFK